MPAASRQRREGERERGREGERERLGDGETGRRRDGETERGLGPCSLVSSFLYPSFCFFLRLPVFFFVSLFASSLSSSFPSPSVSPSLRLSVSPSLRLSVSPSLRLALTAIHQSMMIRATMGKPNKVERCGMSIVVKTLPHRSCTLPDARAN